MELHWRNLPLVFTLAAAVATPAFGQANGGSESAEAVPDLSGVWWAPVTVEPGKPEWLPFAQQIAGQRQANNRKDSPQARCLPSAIVRLGPLYEFVQSKAVLVLISASVPPVAWPPPPGFPPAPQCREGTSCVPPR